MSTTLPNAQVEPEEISFGIDEENSQLSTIPSGSDYFPDRTFIHINNNWSDTASSYDWCSGDGSLENPYTIQNITVDVTGNSRGWGVKIENSLSEYFALWNVQVKNASAHSSDNGIKIHNSINGLLENITTIDCITGVNISASSHIWVNEGIYNNSIWEFDMSSGILILDSSYIEVSNIYAEGYLLGILGESSDHLTGSNNNFKDSYVGLGSIYSSYFSFQSNNYENVSVPYVFQGSSESVIDGESFYNIERQAVYLLESDNITISNNHFYDGKDIDILVYESENITIENNEFINSNNAAIKINGTSQLLEITNNLFNNYSHVGVEVDDSLNNSLIEHNIFIGGVKATSQAFNLFRVNYTSIQHNWMTNNQYGIYTFYCEDNTIWNNTIVNVIHGIVCEVQNRDFLIQRNTIHNVVGNPLYITSTSSNFDIHGNIIYDFGDSLSYGTNSFTKWNVIDGNMNDMVFIDDQVPEHVYSYSIHYYNWAEAREKFAFVTGSGIVSDPYVISDYTVTSGEFTSSHGVLNVKNSQAHFIMENLTFIDCGAVPSFYAATTTIKNSSNMIIRNNTFLRDRFCAIWMTDSINNTQIINNRMIDSLWEGIYSSTTNYMVNVTIANNIMNSNYPNGSPIDDPVRYNSNYGITLDISGENISVTNNTVTNYTHCISISATGENLDFPIRISGNIISNGKNTGIDIRPDGFVIIENNHINNFTRGIDISSSGEDVIIQNNWINGTDTGIYLNAYDFALIQNNILMNFTTSAISISNGGNNTIIDNEVYLDQIIQSIFELDTTADNIIEDNIFHTPTVELTLLSPSPSENGYIEFEWSAMADITNYLVYRDTSPITTVDSLVFLLNTTSLSFSETLLDNGYYYYAVVVQNNTINGSVSESLAVTVAQPLDAPVLTEITPFHNLDGIVNLDWTDIADASHYYIYRDTEEITDLGGLIPLDELSSAFSTYTDTITQSGMYYYVILASDGIVNSTCSNNAMVSIELPLDAPILESIMPATSSSGIIELQWESVTKANLYYIFRSMEEITTVEGMVPIAAVNSPILTYSDTFVQNDVYYYVIVASDGIVNSSLSNCESVTIHFPPAAPVLDPITPHTNENGIVEISWSTVEGATIYYLYRSTEAITTVNGLTPIASLTSGETIYNDTIAINGTYYYAVVAYDGVVRSDPSNVEDVIISIPPEVDPPTDKKGIPAALTQYLLSISTLTVIALFIRAKKRDKRF